MIMTEAETLYAIHYYSYYYRFSYTPWNIIPKVDMGSIAEHGEFLQHQLIKFACCVLQESNNRVVVFHVALVEAVLALLLLVHFDKINKLNKINLIRFNP